MQRLQEPTFVDKKYLIYLLVLAILTCSIEIDISVPSFPDISDYFGISDGLTQMTVALNFLGFCISSVIYGPLSDSFGRRKIMLFGNAIMVIGACGCSISYTIEFLLFSRFIQGIGASTSAVVVFSIIADSYSNRESSRLVGVMNSLITVFMSVAPLVGSAINEVVGWRGNYILIATLSIISYAMMHFFLPETKGRFNQFKYRDIVSDYKKLLTDKAFLYASFVPSLFYAAWLSFVACSSFLYMESYKLPIMYYAIHQAIIISAFSITSFYSGKIASAIGERKCIIYGSSFAIVASSTLTILSTLAMDSPYLTTIFMSTYGIGSAISYPVIFAKSLTIFPNISGTASSSIMAMRALMCAGFVALSSYLYQGSLLTVALIILLIAFLIAFFSLRLLKMLSFDKNSYST